MGRQRASDEALGAFLEARQQLDDWPNEFVIKAALRAAPEHRSTISSIWESDAGREVQGASGTGRCEIFVRGINYAVDEVELSKHFTQYGKVWQEMC